MIKRRKKEEDALSISHSLMKELNFKNFLTDIFHYLAYNYKTISTINLQRMNIGGAVEAREQEDKQNTLRNN